MRIIARKTLVAYWSGHSGAKEQLEAWYKETENADWTTPDDIKKRYSTASFLADNRVCFNIAGNRYRLIVKVNYRFHMVYIRFVGTHAEYSRIDAEVI